MDMCGMCLVQHSKEIDRLHGLNVPSCNIHQQVPPVT